MSNGENPYLVLKPSIIAGLVPKLVFRLIILIVIYAILKYSHIILGIEYPIIQLISGLIFLSFGYQIDVEPYVLPVFAAIYIILAFLSYMNLRARRYNFFGDRAEFYEGFLNINRTVVRYDKVTDITFNRSVWGRILKTGDIMLNTSGSQYQELHLLYIKNSERIYEDVQKLVRKHSGGSVKGRDLPKNPAAD